MEYSGFFGNKVQNINPKKKAGGKEEEAGDDQQVIYFTGPYVHNDN